jgi:hypothetical protein
MIEALKILDAMAEKTRGMIESYCNWESRRPFTHNTGDLEISRPTIYLDLAKQRYVKGKPANSFRSPDPPSPTYLDETDADFNSKLQKATEDNPYKTELGIAADIAAYYTVAVKRAVDIVPMCTENEFLVAFGGELRKTLEKRLGLIGESGSETCEKYAVEDIDIQGKRTKLIEMRDTLIMAKDIMNQI